MAHLAKIEVVISDPLTGLPVSGATVEIRKQGGTVQGTTGPTTIDLHTQGAMSVGDTVNIDADADTPVAILTQPTGTQITVNGAGLAPLINDVTRVTVTSPLPTVYNAEDGLESKTNPLTTDANGLAFAYGEVGLYDAFVTRGGDTFLLQNIPSLAGSKFLSNIWGTGTEDAYIFDTFRALATGDNIASFRDNGVEKAFIDKDGLLDVAEANITGLATIAGDLLLAGEIQMSAASSRLVPGTVEFSTRNNADTRDNLLMVDAGDLTVFRDANARRLRLDSGTILVSGDFGDVSNMGAGATYAPVGTDAAGLVTVTLGTGLAASQPEFALTYTDGTYGNFSNVMATCKNTTTGIVTPIFTAGGSTSVNFIIGDATPTDSHVYQIAWIGVGRTSA